MDARRWVIIIVVASILGYIYIESKKPLTFRVFIGRDLKWNGSINARWGTDGPCINFTLPDDYIVRGRYYIPLVGPYTGHLIYKNRCWRDVGGVNVKWNPEFHIYPNGNISYINHTLQIPLRCCEDIHVERQLDIIRISTSNCSNPCSIRIPFTPTGIDVYVNGLPIIENLQKFCGISMGECQTDQDCVVDGCSREVCRSIHRPPVNTICIWRDCYAVGSECHCINHRCQWA